MKAHTSTPRSHKTRHKNRSASLPLLEHIRELRQRLFYIAIFLALFTGIGALIREQLIAVLLKPAHNQEFIYTTPAGGFDFNFRICLYFGLALSVPALIYNLFKYLEPIVPRSSARFISRSAAASTVLAVAGACFGYFVSLPAALHFLLNQFSESNIKALLTIQDYMSFVLIYLFGAALLFQIPLILLFINRIKPLRPLKLMSYQRYVILVSFIVAAVITPTGDLMNQTIMAVPIMLMYQLGVIAIWVHNRRTKRHKIDNLWQQDEAERAKRQARLQQATPVQPLTAPLQPTPIVQSSPTLLAPVATSRPLPRAVTQSSRPSSRYAMNYTNLSPDRPLVQ